jgi:hypothetical protein
MSESQKVPMQYRLVYDTALRVAGEQFTVTSTDPKVGTIQCKTSASIRSWGETINIRIRRLQDEETEITVESSASAQLFDWGKSEENIQTFFSSVKAALSRK